MPDATGALREELGHSATTLDHLERAIRRVSLAVEKDGRTHGAGRNSWGGCDVSPQTLETLSLAILHVNTFVTILPPKIDAAGAGARDSLAPTMAQAHVIKWALYGASEQFRRLKPTKDVAGVTASLLTVAAMVAELRRVLDRHAQDLAGVAP